MQALLDDLIRPDQERLRDRQAERLGGLHMYDQIKPHGSLDWLGSWSRDAR